MPVRKKASRNSSNEIVKVSSRLATTPGRAIGKVTRQNAIQAVSPRSSAASSRLPSWLSSRDVNTKNAKGTQITTWPMPTESSDRPSPDLLKATSNAMPRMMKGITNGSVNSPVKIRAPGRR